MTYSITARLAVHFGIFNFKQTLEGALKAALFV